MSPSVLKSSSRETNYLWRFPSSVSNSCTFFRSIFFLFSSILLLTSSLYSTELKIVPNYDLYKVGDSVIVNVTINDIDNLFGVGFNLLYNSNQLRYISATESSFISSNNSYQTIFLTKNEPDRNRIITGLSRSDYANGGAVSIDDTVLMSFVFEILLSDSIALIIDRSSLVAPDGITKFDHVATDGFIISQIATDILENNVLPLDYTFAVSHNYPNPFNGVTSFNYSISTATNLKIDVINILGQNVSTVENNCIPSGNYNLEWVASDKNGKELPSGVYFFVFKTDHEIKTRKIMYLK